MYMCDTSDAGVSPICFATTRALKQLLTSRRVHLVGNTNDVNLVHSITSTILTGNNRIANIVPRFVMRRG